MLNNKTIAVVVPAFNEGGQIGMVIENMPAFVDRIVIVNDASGDNTESIVKGYLSTSHNSGNFIRKEKTELANSKYGRAEEVFRHQRETELKRFPSSKVVNKHPENDRIILINQLQRSGVGAAVARGYQWCKENQIDCVAKMDGDGQMDPDELMSICKPIVEEGIDYVKGNRLIHRSAWLVIPKVRYFGNSILSIMTKIASGYWHVSDSQTAFVAISRNALNAIRIHNIYRTYGYPNDMLVKLNIAFCTIKEVEIKPIYEIGEKSKMKIFNVIVPISWLLFKSFFKRLWIKYLFRDFHPLFLFYNFSLLLGVVWLPYLFKVGDAIVHGRQTSFETLFAFSFIGITAFQSLFFAMWMDMQDNERLYKS